MRQRTMRKVRAACTLVLLAGAWVAAAQAQTVWQFVDRDGVTHMGNVPPPAPRGVIWIEGVGSATPAGQSKSGNTQAAKLPGYAAAQPLLEEAARAQALEPALVIAVAAAESGFNADAVSRKGALGLMQVMPATAERYGVAGRSGTDGRHAVMEPKLNVQVGSRYLADLLRMFDGDKELALAAYNAGEGAVVKHGRRIPPYPETRQYVDKVMRLYQTLVR
ncbi:transglycosylase SLT domain-containing protein [Alicycliphilus denitrificans]|nr:transglycosylase SLT domain-containing protein [Alicycliphilus denitrificans]